MVNKLLPWWDFGSDNEGDKKGGIESKSYFLKIMVQITLKGKCNVMYTIIVVIIIVVTIMRSKGAERRQGLYRASFSCGRTGRQHYHFSFQPKSNYAQRKGIDILIKGTQLTMRFTDLPKEVSPSKFYFYSPFTSSLFPTDL